MTRPCLLLVTILIGSSVGCSRGTRAPEGGSLRKPSQVILSRQVELGRVQQRSLVYRVETVGMLEAEGQTEIAAGVSGVVDEVSFREGDEVGPGTILVKIDQASYKADAELAMANVERAKANWDLARDIADRTERAGRAVSEEDRAKARGALRVAEAEYRSAVAAKLRAENNLERSQVRAPYAGRINKRNVTKGSYLEEKTVIATMADLSRIRLVGYVPETAAPVLRDHLSNQEERVLGNRIFLALGASANPFAALTTLSGQSLVSRDYVPSGYDPEFELETIRGTVFHARIFYMSTVANTDTHMFEAKAEVLGVTQLPKGESRSPKPALTTVAGPIPSLKPTISPAPKRDSPRLFWPGYTARIRFPLRSNPGALVIPEEAVRSSERGTIAFVPVEQIREDGKTEWVAKMRTLVLGFRADGWVEVSHGLREGELIVRRGAEALEDGTPVSFKK